MVAATCSNDVIKENEGTLAPEAGTSEDSRTSLCSGMKTELIAMKKSDTCSSASMEGDGEGEKRLLTRSNGRLEGVPRREEGRGGEGEGMIVVRGNAFSSLVRNG